MANPVITGFTPAGPITVPAGGSVAIVVAATDADARTESYEVQVRDAGGHLSNVVPLQFVFPDPLEVVVTPPVDSRGTSAVDPANKLRFTVTSLN